MEFPHCFVNLLSFNSDFKMLYRYFCLFKFSVGAAVFMEYILGVSYNAKCFTCNQISQQPYKVNTIITLVLRMKKLKSRVSTRDHWGLNSSLRTLKALPQPTKPHVPFMWWLAGFSSGILRQDRGPYNYLYHGLFHIKLCKYFNPWQRPKEAEMTNNRVRKWLISELFSTANIKINNWYLNFICTVRMFDDLNTAKRFDSINEVCIPCPRALFESCR